MDRALDGWNVYLYSPECTRVPVSDTGAPLEHRNCAAFQQSSGLARFAVDPAHCWSARCFRVSFIVTYSGSALVQRQRVMMQRGRIFGITLALKETATIAPVCHIPKGQERDLGRMRGFL